MIAGRSNACLSTASLPSAHERPMESRKFQRFSDNSHVIFSSDNVKGEGRLENISLGGAAILSDLTIARGEYLRLKITFPTQAGAIEIELAPVRWVKPGSFGVEFIRMAPSSQQRLKQYLETLEGTSSDAA
jgi:c-di-GMP-binding flagellar brake protein YcgR